MLKLSYNYNFAILKKYSQLLVILVFSVIVLSNAFIQKPKMRSEWEQQLAYLIAIGSKFQLSIDQNVMNKVEKIDRGADFSRIKNRFFEAKNGSVYSHHYWFNAFIATPSYIFLKAFDLDKRRSFLLNNSILLILLFSYFVRYVRFENQNIKIFIMALIFVNPMLRYINWPIQAFPLYIFVTFATLFLYQKKYSLSILFSVIAAQQQPIISFFTLLICITFITELFLKYCKQEKSIKAALKQLITNEHKKIIINFIISLFVFSQPLFYFYNFGIWSILAKKGLWSVDNITINKTFSVLFDLNQGILTYHFIAVVTAAILLLISLTKRDILSKAIFLCIIVTCTFISGQLIWNPIYSGVIRYASFVIPLITLIVIINHQKLSLIRNRTLNIITLISIILVTYQISTPSLHNHSLHTPTAKFVLNNAPWLYNPVHDIFKRRHLTSARQKGYKITSYNDKNNIPRKILVENAQKLISNQDGLYLINNAIDKESLISKIIEKKKLYNNQQFYININSYKSELINSNYINNLKITRFDKDNIDFKNLELKCDVITINTRELKSLFYKFNISIINNNNSWLKIGDQNNKLFITSSALDENKNMVFKDLKHLRSFKRTFLLPPKGRQDLLINIKLRHIKELPDKLLKISKKNGYYLKFGIATINSEEVNFIKQDNSCLLEVKF